MQTIYVTALAQPMSQIFNAIAEFYKPGGSWISAQSIFMMLSAVGVIVMVMMMRNSKPIMPWIMGITIVPFILSSPKTSVNIVNMTQPLEAYQVDNVPSGLAVPISIISGIAYGFQTTLTKVYHTPQNSDYNQTGMMFGSELFKELSHLHPNAKNQAVLDGYMGNCVLTDVQIRGKYTYNELFNSPNIVKFLEKNATKDTFDKVDMHDGTLNKPDLITCQDALPKIKEMLYKNVDAAKYQLSASLSHSIKSPIEQSKIMNAISDVSAAYFNGYSISAKNTLVQNMFARGVQNGLLNNSVAHGAGASLNYAYTKAQMSSTAQNLTAGMLAQKYIPQLQTILFMLLVAVFPIMVFVMMLPGMSMKIAKSYGYSLVWVNLWSIFYIVLNFISHAILESHINQLFGSGTTPGYTLNALDPINNSITEYASVTGYLMMSIPFISMMITKPLSEVMGNMATSFMNRMASNTHQSSEFAVDGNINMGSVNMDNSNIDNASRHQKQLSPMLNTGASTVSQGGASVTNFTDPNGHSIGQKVDLSQREYITGLSGNASQSLTTTYSEASNLSSTEANDISARYHDTTAHSASMGNASNSALSRSTTEANDNIHQFTSSDKYSGSKQVMTAISASMHEGVNSSKSLAGAVAGALTGLNASVGSDQSLRWQGLDDKGYSVSAEQLGKLAQSESIVESASQSNSTSIDDRQSIDYAKGYTSSMNQAVQYQQLANYSSQHAETINSSLSKPMNDYMYQEYRLNGLVDFQNNPSSPTNIARREEAFEHAIKQPGSMEALYGDMLQQQNNDSQSGSFPGASSNNSMFNTESSNLQSRFDQSKESVGNNQGYNDMRERISNDMGNREQEYTYSKDKAQQGLDDNKSYIQNHEPSVPDKISDIVNSPDPVRLGAATLLKDLLD